jgi:hypothetical protein
MISNICTCGHKKEDHINGVGECKECDLQAGYGGNDNCSKYSEYISKPPVKLKTLEDRFNELEEEKIQDDKGITMKKLLVIEKIITLCSQCAYYHYGYADDTPAVSVCVLSNKKYWHSNNQIYIFKSVKNWDGENIPEWCELPSI